MNDDNKLMQEFMDSFKDEKAENVTPYYKASSNMNLQLGNPDFNMNNSMDVNIKDNNDLKQNEINNSSEMAPILNDKNDIVVNNNVLNSTSIKNNTTSYVSNNNSQVNKTTNDFPNTANNNTEVQFNYSNPKINYSEKKTSHKKNGNVSGDLRFVVLLSLVFMIVILFLIPSLSSILNNFFINR